MKACKLFSTLLSILFVLTGIALQLFLTGYMASTLLFFLVASILLFFSWTDRKKHKKLRLVVLILICIWIVCVVTAEVPIVSMAHFSEDISCEYLVIMGAGIRGTEPSLSMQNRLDVALSYLQKHKDCIVVVSGSQAPDEAVSEASVMKNWLEKNGIPEDHILLEEQADSTYENILYSVSLIESVSGKASPSVSFLSSEYHIYRIKLLCKYLNLENIHFIPATTSLTGLRLNYYFREAVAVWKTWIFGV